MDFPTDMRPSRAITFDEVIPISAKTSVEDIENLKLKLRNYIDLHADEDNEHAENHLTDKLRSINLYDTGYV